MGRSRNALWVRPFHRLCLLRSEIENIFTFQAVTDPSANQIALCGQIPLKVCPPICQTLLLSSVDGRLRKWGDRYLLMDGILLTWQDSGCHDLIAEGGYSAKGALQSKCRQTTDGALNFSTEGQPNLKVHPKLSWQKMKPDGLAYFFNVLCTLKPSSQTFLLG